MKEHATSSRPVEDATLRQTRGKPEEQMSLKPNYQDKPKTKAVTVGSDHNKIVIGGHGLVVIAGPCSIESEAHLRITAEAVKASGATILRGGVFKMRTSPDSFQGIGTPAFDFLGKVKSDTGMPMVCEITDPRQLEQMLDSVDMFQVGSRNMYNYELLKELGRTRRPVMLKRAFAATIDEWVHAAEYVVKGGNDQVVLCERGIRTFETATRNTLDLNAVAWIKAHTDFAVIVDPSHGTGKRELVIPMALAGLAAGADGIICEVHPSPEKALSDSFQALDFNDFAMLVERAKAIGLAVDRPILTAANRDIFSSARGADRT
jgi:3-deoxy-7-phosphoheptulonate synthase